MYLRTAASASNQEVRVLSIRLKRMGRKHRPYYRLVVSDSRKRTTGDSVDEVGQYDPVPNPSKVTIDMERVDYWLSKGAKPSATVAKLIAISRKGPQA
jgi:small subunit ribosomal protein S16